MFRHAPRLRRRAVLASALLVAVMAVLFAILLSTFADRHSALNAVARGEQRLRRSAELRQTLVDVETGVRGFQITHANVFLQPYDAGLKRLPREIARMRQDTAERALVNRIAAGLRDYQEYANTVIAAETAGTQGRGVELRTTLAGKRKVDALRVLFDRYDGERQAALTRAEGTAHDTSDATRSASIAVLVGVALALLAYGLMIVRGVAVPLERAGAAARRRELEAINAQLQTANQDLEQFAYVASHDLGEPLRTIAGFAELLERRATSRLSEADQEYVDHIVAGAAHMRALIDDLLAYARSGGTELQVQEVDMRAAAERVVVQLQAGDRVRIGELPRVSADPVLVTQVLQNLIANALKFTDGGPADVDVGAEQVQDAWRIDVRDHGIGIEPDHAEVVFGMFRRLNAPDRFTGTGIGLAICQRIVERHGGRIWVSPAEGGGSVFSFTLPAAPAHS
jgi:signal transduction histidine kinase